MKKEKCAYEKRKSVVSGDSGKPDSDSFGKYNLKTKPEFLGIRRHRPERCRGSSSALCSDLEFQAGKAAKRASGTVLSSGDGAYAE